MSSGTRRSDESVRLLTYKGCSIRYVLLCVLFKGSPLGFLVLFIGCFILSGGHWCPYTLFVWREIRERNREERNREEMVTFSCLRRREIGKKDCKIVGPTTFCFLRITTKKGERIAIFCFYSIFTLVFKYFILIN